MAERQVSTATKTGLGTTTKEQRLPLLDLNFFTEEPAVSINNDDGRTEAMFSTYVLYRIDQFVTTRKLSDIVIRGTQRDYSSKPLKHSIVECILVFKR